MKKKILKSLIIIAIISIPLGAFSGCSKKMNVTEEQKVEILNEIKLFELGREGKTLEDLEKSIDDYIDLYNEEERDIMVDKYIYESVVASGSLTEKLTMIGFELEEVVDTYKIDVNNPKTYNKIPDAHSMVKGFLEEVHDKGFALEKVKGATFYTININSSEMYEKYGDKVSPSLSAFLKFNDYEFKSEPFINADEKEVDLKEVAKRIKMLEDGLKIDKQQEYLYVNNWTEPMAYYYSILLGLSHDYFVSEKKLSEEVFNTYKELQAEYKDSTIGQILGEIVPLFEKSELKVTDKELKAVIEISEKKIFTEEIQKAMENYSSVDINPDVEIEEEVVSK